MLKYCRTELLDQNYFHAVFEASKGVAERIRGLFGFGCDGADLLTKAFKGQQPILILGPVALIPKKANGADLPIC